MFKQRRRAWNQEELEFLYKNAGILPTKEIATKLLRTECGIAQKSRKLKLSIKTAPPQPWSKSEIEFLQQNANKLQTHEIAQALNKSERSISSKSIKLGIINTDYKYDFLLDFTKMSPYLAYFYGFFFADGCVVFPQGKNLHTRIGITVKNSDACYIDNVIYNICHKGSRRIKQLSTGSQICIYDFRSKPLVEFIGNKLGFKYKNQFFDSRIFKFIPERYHSYFWRGYFDGDGSAILRSNRLGINCTFCGPVNFNYSLLEDKMRDLNIKAKRYESDNLQSQRKIRGRWSTLNIGASHDAAKWLNYIYKDMSRDNIGFTRKYIKYITYLEKRALSPYKDRMKSNKDLLST